MLFCTKCHSLCEESFSKCPHCKNARSLRSVAEEDFVLLQRADEYTAQRLAEAFAAGQIEHQVENFGKNRVSYFYDSEIMPTDKNIYVKYSQLSASANIAARIEQEIQQERLVGQEEFEDMPPKKRLVVQGVSVVAFLLLVVLVVLGADLLAGWLKEIFF